jgi:hypothetical protein
MASAGDQPQEDSRSERDLDSASDEEVIALIDEEFGSA